MKQFRVLNETKIRKPSKARREYDIKMQSIEKRPVKPDKMNAHHPLGEDGGLAVVRPLSDSPRDSATSLPISGG